MTKTSDKSLYLVVVASVIHSAASRKFFAANVADLRGFLFNSRTFA